MSDAGPLAEVFRDSESLFEEMVAQQRTRVLSLARQINPSLCSDDLLSPYDFPSVAQDPRFNFEDGVLAGLISARTALRARVILPRS